MAHKKILQLSYLTLLFCIIIGSGCSPKKAEPDSSTVLAQPTVIPPNAQIRAIVGTELIDRNGEPVAPEVLVGKKLGLFFAAQWSPPSRYFTKYLLVFYARVQAKHEAFEIVFVPADHAAQDQMRHMQSVKMPWPAIPYKNQAQITKLRLDYGVNQTGVPLLVILNTDGSLITTEGRSEVMRKGVDAYQAW